MTANGTGQQPAQPEPDCGCVYATSANTESVRKGYEMGGYVKRFCAEHARPGPRTDSYGTELPPISESDGALYGKAAAPAVRRYSLDLCDGESGRCRADMSADADGDYVLATAHEAALAAAQRDRDAQAELAGALANELTAEREKVAAAERRVAELVALNAERNRQNALAFEERDRLRAKLRQLAGECAECGGTGLVTVSDYDGNGSDADDQPCPDCEDIRGAAR